VQNLSITNMEAHQDLALFVLVSTKTHNSRLINGRNSSAYRNWYELGGYAIRIRVYILKVRVNMLWIDD
jgi:thiamine kinase-like enzyme